MTALVLALAVASASPAQWAWQQTRPYGDVYILTHNGGIVGRWDARSGSYFPAVGPGMYAVSEGTPPIDPPAKNYGLDQRRLEDGERWTRQATKIDRESALQLIDRAGAVTPIAGAPAPLRVVLVGEKQKCDRAAEQIGAAGALSQLRERFRVDSLRPEQWQCRAGYTGGNPACYVVRASGRVEHVQDGPDGLADAVAAVLRDPDPAFRRDRVPDRRRLLSPFSFPKLPMTGAVCVVGLVAVLALGWGMRR